MPLVANPDAYSTEGGTHLAVGTPGLLRPPAAGVAGVPEGDFPVSSFTGGMTLLGQVAENLSVGQFAVLHDYNQRNWNYNLLNSGNTSNSNNKIIEFCNDGAWDPINKRAHIVSEGHFDQTPPLTSAGKWVMWDDANDQWYSRGKDCVGAKIGHGYQNLGVDTTRGDLYLFPKNQAAPGPNIHHWAFQAGLGDSTGQWVNLPKPPAGQVSWASEACFYHPGRDSVYIAAKSWGCWEWSIPSQTWTQRASQNNPNGWFGSSSSQLAIGHDYFEMIHNPIGGFTYVGHGRTSGTLKRLHRWNGAGAAFDQIFDQIPTPPGTNGPSIGASCVEPVTGHYLSYTTVEGTGLPTLYELDPDASPGSQWTRLSAVESAMPNDMPHNRTGDGPLGRQVRKGTVMIPISTYGVVMFVWCGATGNSGKVWIYKHA